LGTEFPVCIHKHGLGTARLRPNVADITAIAHLRTEHVSADTDNVTSCGDAIARKGAQRNVITAGATTVVSTKRMLTNGNIVLAVDVVLERTKTDGRVVSARVVMKKHIISNRDIAAAGGVAEEAWTPIAVFPLPSVLFMSA